MQSKEITEKKIWQNFINSVKPSSFLHSWAAGEIEQQLGKTIFRYGIYTSNDNGEAEAEPILTAVFLLIKVIARRGTFLLCPHGPIISQKYLKNTKEIFQVIRDSSLELARKQHCDFIRISTLIPESTEHTKIIHDLGFRDAPIHMHSELAWILDITQSEEELLKGMKKNTRYAIRKAEKDGVTVRMSTSHNDFETFWNIYMTTASRQHFTPFSKVYLEKEFEVLFKEHQALLFFAEYRGKAISTAFIVYSHASGFYHHGASTQEFAGITASEKIQWEAIKEAKRRGLERYNFWGIVPDTATSHPWFGLSKFKKGFGGYSEAYVHAQDYVVTSKYWLNYLIETIRKKRRRL